MKSLIVSGMVVVVLVVILPSCFMLAEPNPPPHDPKLSTNSYANTPDFGIDSVFRTSSTTFQIQARIVCEKTLTILQRGLHFYEIGQKSDVISKYLLTEPETIDFTNLPDSIYTVDYGYRKVYRHVISIEVPLPDVDYSFCMETKYSIKGPAKYGLACY